MPGVLPDPLIKIDQPPAPPVPQMPVGFAEGGTITAGQCPPGQVWNSVSQRCEAAPAQYASIGLNPLYNPNANAMRAMPDLTLAQPTPQYAAQQAKSEAEEWLEIQEIINQQQFAAVPYLTEENRQADVQSYLEGIESVNQQQFMAPPRTVAPDEAQRWLDVQSQLEQFEIPEGGGYLTSTGMYETPSNLREQLELGRGQTEYDSLYGANVGRDVGNVLAGGVQDSGAVVGREFGEGIAAILETAKEVPQSLKDLASGKVPNLESTKRFDPETEKYGQIGEDVGRVAGGVASWVVPRSNEEWMLELLPVFGTMGDILDLSRLGRRALPGTEGLRSLEIPIFHRIANLLGAPPEELAKLAEDPISGQMYLESVLQANNAARNKRLGELAGKAWVASQEAKKAQAAQAALEAQRAAVAPGTPGVFSRADSPARAERHAFLEILQGMVREDVMRDAPQKFSVDVESNRLNKGSPLTTPFGGPITRGKDGKFYWTPEGRERSIFIGNTGEEAVSEALRLGLFTAEPGGFLSHARAVDMYSYPISGTGTKLVDFTGRYEDFATALSSSGYMRKLASSMDNIFRVLNESYDTMFPGMPEARFGGFALTDPNATRPNWTSKEGSILGVSIPDVEVGRTKRPDGRRGFASIIYLEPEKIFGDVLHEFMSNGGANSLEEALASPRFREELADQFVTVMAHEIAHRAWGHEHEEEQFIAHLMKFLGDGLGVNVDEELGLPGSFIALDFAGRATYDQGKNSFFHTGREFFKSMSTSDMEAFFNDFSTHPGEFRRINSEHTRLREEASAAARRAAFQNAQSGALWARPRPGVREGLPGGPEAARLASGADVPGGGQGAQRSAPGVAPGAKPDPRQVWDTVNQWVDAQRKLPANQFVTLDRNTPIGTQVPLGPRNAQGFAPKLVARVTGGHFTNEQLTQPVGDALEFFVDSGMGKGSVPAGKDPMSIMKALIDDGFFDDAAPQRFGTPGDYSEAIKDEMAYRLASANPRPSIGAQDTTRLRSEDRFRQMQKKASEVRKGNLANKSTAQLWDELRATEDEVESAREIMEMAARGESTTIGKGYKTPEDAAIAARGFYMSWENARRVLVQELERRGELKGHWFQNLPTVQDVRKGAAPVPPEIRALYDRDISKAIYKPDNFIQSTNRIIQRDPDLLSKLQNLMQAKPIAAQVGQFIEPIAASRATRGLRAASGAPLPGARQNPIPEAVMRMDLYATIEKAKAHAELNIWIAENGKGLGLDSKGIARGVPMREGAKIPKLAQQRLDDIVENPGDYILTDGQREALDQLLQTENAVLQEQLTRGINIRELGTGASLTDESLDDAIGEGAERYWARIVTKYPDEKTTGIKPRVKSRVVGTKPGHAKPRRYGTVREGIEAGYEYANPIQAITARIESGIDSIAEAEMLGRLKTLGVKPSKKVDPKFQEAEDAARKAFVAQRRITSRKDATLDDLAEFEVRQEELHRAMQANRFAKENARSPTHTETTIRGMIMPLTVKAEIEKYVDLFPRGGGPLDLVNEGFQMWRGAMITGDFSQMFVQGTNLFYRNPVGWGKAVAHSAVSIASNPWSYVTKNAETIREAIQYGGVMPPAEFLLKQGKELGAARLGRTWGIRHIQNAFEWFTFVGQVEQWKALKGATMRGKHGEALTDVDYKQIASATRKQMGIVLRPGLTKTQRAIQNFILFAPSFRSSFIGIMTDATKGGQRGWEARRLLGQVFGGAASMTIGAHMLFNNGEMPNMTDPTKPGFWGFRPPKFSLPVLGDFDSEGYIYPLGPWQSWFRMFATASEGVAEGDAGKVGEAATFFARGGSGLQAGVFADILFGETIMGEPVDFGSVKGLKRYFTESRLPGPIGWIQVFEDSDPFKGDFSGIQNFPARILELGGVRTTPQTPRQILDSNFNEAKQLALQSGAIPPNLADSIMNLSWRDMTGRERRIFEPYLEQVRPGTMDEVVAQARKSQSIFQSARDYEEEYWVKSKPEADTLWMQLTAGGIKDYSKVEDRLKEMIGESAAGYNSPDYREAVDGLESSNIYKLMDLWYELIPKRYTVGVETNWDAVEAERERLLSTLDRSDPDLAARLRFNTQPRAPQADDHKLRQLYDLARPMWSEYYGLEDDDAKIQWRKENAEGEFLLWFFGRVTTFVNEQAAELALERTTGREVRLR